MTMPVIVGLVLVGGAVVWTAWAFRLPPSARSDALAVLGIMFGLIGFLPLVVELGRRRRPPDPLVADKLADLLAQAVRAQWRKAATERVLVTPAPIPVRWSLSDCRWQDRWRRRACPSS